MNLDLSTMSPSDIAALKALLNQTDETGRSPVRERQLHDLRLLPTKDDPRPTFFWSADQPRNGGDLTKTTLYPRLMWHKDSGKEVTAADLKAQETYTASGYITLPPANAEQPDPMEELQSQWALLSDEDRKTILDAQKQSQMESIQAQIARLSPADREALMAGASKVKKTRVA